MSKDLFGNITVPKEITVNVYHDEREIQSRWLYHSFLFVPTCNEKEVLDLLMEKRKLSKWNKEIHFVDLKDTVTANQLALGWVELFGAQFWRKVYLYFLGVNYQNLEKTVWEKKATRDFKIYNRFFQIGLYGAIKWLFINSMSGFEKVAINNIFSDSKSRTPQDKFHTQPIQEVEGKALYKGENIVFSCNRIVEIDSDHENESDFPDASHLVQFVDIISGTLSQIYDATSTHLGKHGCAKKLLSYGLPECVTKYDSAYFQGPYCKRYAVSFFPKEKLSRDMISSGRSLGNMFYYSRDMVFVRTRQVELFQGLDKTRSLKKEKEKSIR